MTSEHRMYIQAEVIDGDHVHIGGSVFSREPGGLHTSTVMREMYRKLCCDLLANMEVIAKGGVDLDLPPMEYAAREYERCLGRYDEIRGLEDDLRTRHIPHHRGKEAQDVLREDELLDELRGI